MQLLLVHALVEGLGDGAADGALRVRDVQVVEGHRTHVLGSARLALKWLYSTAVTTRGSHSQFPTRASVHPIDIYMCRQIKIHVQRVTGCLVVLRVQPPLQW